MFGVQAVSGAPSAVRAKRKKLVGPGVPPAVLASQPVVSSTGTVMSQVDPADAFSTKKS